MLFRAKREGESEKGGPSYSKHQENTTPRESDNTDTQMTKRNDSAKRKNRIQEF